MFPGVSFCSTGISQSMAQAFSPFPDFRLIFSDATDDPDGDLVNNLSVDIEGQEPNSENCVSSFIT